MKNYNDVPVQFNETYGNTVLLTKEICDELGISKTVSQGPITFGHGKSKVTLATPEWGQSNLNEIQGSNR